MKVFKKILLSIIALPLGILGAICLLPFVALALLVDLPWTILEDIWLERSYYEESEIE